MSSAAEGLHTDSPDIRSFGNEEALRVVGAAVNVLSRGNAQINGIPVEHLIAKELGREDWDRIGAEQHVSRLLEMAKLPTSTATNIDYARQPIDYSRQPAAETAAQ